MPSTMTLGERIRNARATRGLTQEDVADKIGVLANTVSRWERDVCPPRGVAKKWLRRHWPEVFSADEPDDDSGEHVVVERESLTGTD